MHQVNDRPATSKLRSHWKSVVVIFVASFVAESSRGLVLATLTPYIYKLGGTKESIGIAVSLYSLGRLISAIPLGYIADRLNSTNICLLVSTLMAMFGNILYSFASFQTGGQGLSMIYASRFLIGFGTGTMGICRSFMVKVSDKGSERTAAMSIAGLSQYIGFALSPGIASLMLYVQEKVQPQDVPEEVTDVDGQKTTLIPIHYATVPGYVLGVMNLIVVMMLLAMMPWRDPTDDKKNGSSIEEAVELEENHASCASVSSDRTLFSTETSTTKPPKNRCTPHITRFQLSFALFLFLNFVLRGIIGISETNAPTELIQNILPTSQNVESLAGMYFFLLGLIGLLPFFFLSPAQRLCDRAYTYLMHRLPSDSRRRKWTTTFLQPQFFLLVVGVFLLILGTVFSMRSVYESVPNPVPIYMVGLTFIWSIGSPICQTMTMSTFSETRRSGSSNDSSHGSDESDEANCKTPSENDETKSIGTLMAWFATAGSIGRIVFPLAAGLVEYDVMNTISLVLCLFCVVLLWTFNATSSP